MRNGGIVRNRDEEWKNSDEEWNFWDGNGGIKMRNGGIYMRNVGIEIWYKVYLKKEGYAERIMNDKLQLREKGKKDEKEENVGLLDNVSRILKNNKI